MYRNSFQRTNPGLFVFLLDQSGSMHKDIRTSESVESRYIDNQT